MRKWSTFLKEHVDTGLWGLIALDEYYKNRASGTPESPVGFLRRIVKDLSPVANDAINFQRVLLACSVQLLGDDFPTIAQLAKESILASKSELQVGQTEAVSNLYSIYGQSALVRGVLDTIGSVNQEAPMAKSDSLQFATVVVIDLVGYSDVIRVLEQNLDSRAVASVNTQIQEMITESIEKCGLSAKDSLIKTTGDGAILQFDRADNAHAVAVGIHKLSDEYNVKRSEASAKRYFRIGIATGEITRHTSDDGTIDFAGLTISNAVRLESQSRPGEIVADLESFRLLPTSMQAQYGKEEAVRGKRNEEFAAHRCTVIPGIPAKQGATVEEPKPNERRQILKRIQELGQDAVDELIFLLEMPAREKPPSTLTTQQRCNLILAWADSSNRLADLDFELQNLISGKS